MPLPFSTVEQLAVGLILIFVTATLFSSWKRIRFFWIRHKIQPYLDQITQSYREEIGDYVEVFPRLVVSDKKQEGDFYGVIFATPEEVHAVEEIFLINIPPACSFRRIRLLFDPNLKKAVFDYFSWRVAIRRNREDIASKILDNALIGYSREFRAVQKLHEGEKLSAIVLQEALRRLRRYKNLANISPDDVEEFSGIVRAWVERDFELVLIGNKAPEFYADRVLNGLTGHREVLALARRESHVKTLNEVIELCRKGISPLYTASENDQWYFVEKESTVPVLRVWFRRTPFEDMVRFSRR